MAMRGMPVPVRWRGMAMRGMPRSTTRTRMAPPHRRGRSCPRWVPTAGPSSCCAAATASTSRALMPGWRRIRTQQCAAPSAARALLGTTMIRARVTGRLAPEPGGAAPRARVAAAAARGARRSSAGRSTIRRWPSACAACSGGGRASSTTPTWSAGSSGITAAASPKTRPLRVTRRPRRAAPGEAPRMAAVAAASAAGALPAAAAGAGNRCV
mmetsp:Transcript_10948/g.33326  ORF Transcript_10948/g.33326 Transcript_10948/m.33326 type:complete len:212 (+) Transcript_10948:1044-1679(+)